MEMTRELFEDIINTAQDCVFWKDKDRRFVGANQAFLDFYGFDSLDVILGKNDEDMGWHSNPGPFMKDEMRVLSGEETYKVPGKCMVKGEERDIIASKKPLYKNGQIVGLVGSFMDVTDVVASKRNEEKSQVLYEVEHLRKYPFFDKILDQVNIENILDPLIGIVNRSYMVDFAQNLIKENIPFSFTIFDLDNFKYINDNYGHHAGDCILQIFAKDLVEMTKDYCIVGRFGGDELLIINLRDVDKEKEKTFFHDLFENGKIVRRNIKIGKYQIHVTGTAGCSLFPEDSKEYMDLFNKADITLYDGKRRGRNCYTIYESRKHKEVNIKKNAKNGIYINMTELARILETSMNMKSKISGIVNILKEQININAMFYIDEKNMLISSDNKEKAEVEDVSFLLENGVYSDNNLENLHKRTPKLYEYLSNNHVKAVMIMEIRAGEKVYGHLVLVDSDNNHIWQQEESALLLFLAKQMAIIAHRMPI